MVKNLCCSCRESELLFQHPCWVTQLPVTPVPRDLISSGLLEHLCHLHVDTDTEIKTNLKELYKWLLELISDLRKTPGCKSVCKAVMGLERLSKSTCCTNLLTRL